ncbi:MAG: glycosyltransferase, partial [Anaerolineae bacterium]
YRAVLPDKEVGLLVPAKDVHKLADAIVRLLQDPAQREAMARHGRVRAQIYDWAQIAERVLRYYAQRRSFAARRVDRWEVEHAHG